MVNDVEEITKHAQQQTYNTNLEKRADTCTIEIELERVTSQVFYLNMYVKKMSPFVISLIFVAFI